MSSNESVASEIRGREGIFAFLLFPVFVLAFGGALCVFDLLERLSFRLFGKKGLERVVAVLNRVLKGSLRILGTRFVVEGSDPLPPNTPCVIVSNHQALHDIPLLAVLFSAQRPRYVSKQELARWIPGVSFNLRSGESALIDRRNASQALREIVKLGKRIEAERFGAVIFPEGTRARDGELKPFRPSGFAALLRAAPSAKVVPVAIDGAWMLATKKFGPIPLGITVKVRVGAALEPKDFASAEALLEQCHRFVDETLNMWRLGQRIHPLSSQSESPAL